MADYNGNYVFDQRGHDKGYPIRNEVFPVSGTRSFKHSTPAVHKLILGARNTIISRNGIVTCGHYLTFLN